MKVNEVPPEQVKQVVKNIPELQEVPKPETVTIKCPHMGGAPCLKDSCGGWIPETSKCWMRQVCVELSIPNKDYQDQDED